MRAYGAAERQMTTLPIRSVALLCQQVWGCRDPSLTLREGAPGLTAGCHTGLCKPVLSSQRKHFRLFLNECCIYIMLFQETPSALQNQPWPDLNFSQDMEVPLYSVKRCSQIFYEHKGLGPPLYIHTEDSAVVTAQCHPVTGLHTSSLGSTPNTGWVALIKMQFLPWNVIQKFSATDTFFSMYGQTDVYKCMHIDVYIYIYKIMHI